MNQALLSVNSSKISEVKYRWRNSLSFKETDWWKFNEAAKIFKT